jgi:hypothetical protein
MEQQLSANQKLILNIESEIRHWRKPGPYFVGFGDGDWLYRVGYIVIEEVWVM